MLSLEPHLIPFAVCNIFYSLPNDKILALSKLKVFAEDKLNAVKMVISLFDRIENTMGKGKNADYQHFFLCLQCYPKLSSLVSIKLGIVW